MKIILYLFLFLIGVGYAENSFRVEVKDEQPDNDKLLGLRIRLVNESEFQYGNILVKLFIRKSVPNKYVVEKYYIANSFIKSIENEENFTIVEINFKNVNRGVFPEECGISLGVHDSTWNQLNKSLIYNGINIISFSESLPYEIYKGDSLIVSSLNGITPKLRFVGVRPESGNQKSPWVQIQNFGHTKIALSNIYVKDGAGRMHFFTNAAIDPHKTIRICSGILSLCAKDSSIEIMPELSFGNKGELVLYNGNDAIDYIAWGEKGVFADAIDLKKESFNPNEFFETSENPLTGPVSVYHKGDFFRVVIPEGTDSILSWNKYREEFVEKPFSFFPFAEPFSLKSGTEIYKQIGETTVFAWIPINGAKFYELIVLNCKDSSLVFQDTTYATSMSVLLNEGDYLWLVKPYGGNADNEEYYGYTPWDPTFFGKPFPFDFFNLVPIKNLDGSEISIYDLNIEPLAARKDSYMLDLKWGEHIIESDWDKPHNLSGYIDQFGNRRFEDLNHKHYDTEESWRCWAVAAAMVNHHYGGNLTQDEIKYQTSMVSKNHILHAFFHDKEGGGYVYNVLPWCLNIRGSQVNLTNGVPTDSAILNALKNNTPIVVSEGNHIMVIDAARFNKKKGEYIFRFKNVDNDGTVEWRRFNVDAERPYYCLPEDPRKNGKIARRSLLYDDLNGDGVMNLNEVFDKDLDGVIDFDEENRFSTLVDDPDSDHDGIPDKIEIMSYTLRERFPSGFLGVEKETFADIDGDSLRAEKDPDSDDDGKGDGQEDLNFNGLRDYGETDVFSKDKDPNSVIVNKNNITFYAFSQLYYNDRVICYNNQTKTGLCSIASVPKKSLLSQDYAVFIGAYANIGDIYVQGNILLRNQSHVHGNINLIGSGNENHIYKQDETLIDGKITNLSLEMWDEFRLSLDVNLDDFTIPNKSKIVVRNGESFILQPGFYAYIKVEAGGLIYIPAGTSYIGNLQLDSQSKILFTNPGKETVFHVKDYFNWRTTLLNDQTQWQYIAQGFKLVLHKKNRDQVYLGTFSAGSVVAPYSSVIMNQSKKVFYGTVLAENITIHQDAVIHHVAFLL